MYGKEKNITMATETNSRSILYHPLAYIGLRKSVIACINLGLIHAYSIGFGQALLISHVVTFVQEKGLDALFNLNDMKIEFKEEIMQKFQQAGIDLESPVQLEINHEKSALLSLTGNIHRPTDSEFDNSNIYMSSNYNQFNFLKFNRKTTAGHVNDIILSIQEYGILSYGVIVKTDVVDGVMRYWIADGQHRFLAEKKLGFPFYFTMTTVNSLQGLVRLIARLNTTGKKWNLKQYLTTWSSINSNEYGIIQKRQAETGIQLSVLIQIYMDRDRSSASEKFMKGYFEISDKEKAEKTINNLVDLTSTRLLPKSRSISSCLIALMKNNEYNHDHFKEKLYSLPNDFVFAHKEDDLLNQLRLLQH